MNNKSNQKRTDQGSVYATAWPQRFCDVCKRRIYWETQEPSIWYVDHEEKWYCGHHTSVGTDNDYNGLDRRWYVG